MRFSLAAKISALVIALVAIGGGVTAYIVYSNSSKALESSISSNQLEVTKQTMDKIDRFLYERQADIESATSRQQIKDFLTNDKNQDPAAVEQIRQNLQNLKTITASWQEIGVFDASGALLSSTDTTSVNPLKQDANIKRLFEQTIGGQSTYSDVFLDVNGQPTMLFMAPVRASTASSQIIGGIVGELAWPAVLEIIQGLNGPRAEILNAVGKSLGDNNPAGSEPILANSFAGTTVFKQAQKTSSDANVLPGMDDPNHSFVSSYVKEQGYLDYKGNGWLLVLESPSNVTFQPAKATAEKLIVTFAVLLVISVGVFLFILHRLILRPIFNLKEAIGRMSQGDLSSRVSINSRDELGELSRGFNDMADKTQFVYNNLKLSSEEAENEKRTLQTLLDNLPVGVHVVKAPSGESIMLNRIGVELIGRGAMPDAARDGTYAKVFDILKEDGSPYPEDELPMSITLREGKTVFKDNLYVRKPNGVIVILRAITTPIHFVDGSVRTAVGVFEDISVERELERSREEFFSIASHELRTPLTAIMGNSSLIQQYYNDKLPDDDVREMISDIHESSLRLIEIVNDFLDTSRLEQKRMKYETENFDVVKTANSVIKEYQVTGSRKKIHLEVHEPPGPLPMARADQNRTKQVLINLVGNAMKFTEHGSVTISFKLESSFVKVLVSDTGKGMPPEAQKLLFRKFEQTGGTVLTRDSVRGTGLGLYISKLITEQMGGSIHLESSEVGVGTTFSFSLPVAGVPGTPAAVTPPAPSN